MKSAKPENEAERLARRPHHELRDATAVAGAIVGGIIGTMGGLVGIGAGALLGAVIGAVGGQILQRDDRNASAHDRELDEIIGVTTPDIGAADTARDSLTRLESKSREERTSADGELLALDARLDAGRP